MADITSGAAAGFITGIATYYIQKMFFKPITDYTKTKMMIDEEMSFYSDAFCDPKYIELLSSDLEKTLPNLHKHLIADLINVGIYKSMQKITDDDIYTRVKSRRERYRRLASKLKANYNQLPWIYKKYIKNLQLEDPIEAYDGLMALANSEDKPKAHDTIYHIDFNLRLHLTDRSIPLLVIKNHFKARYKKIKNILQS